MGETEDIYIFGYGYGNGRYLRKLFCGFSGYVAVLGRIEYRKLKTKQNH